MGGAIGYMTTKMGGYNGKDHKQTLIASKTLSIKTIIYKPNSLR